MTKVTIGVAEMLLSVAACCYMLLKCDCMLQKCYFMLLGCCCTLLKCYLIVAACCEVLPHVAGARSDSCSLLLCYPAPLCVSLQSGEATMAEVPGKQLNRLTIII